jgi:hypothetical protein
MDNTQQLKYSPKAIGAVNLLLYGSGYLFLHMYLRFFLFFAMLLIAGIFLGTIGTIICYIIVIVDSTRLAQKIQKGEKQLPPANIALTVIIVVVILGLTAFTFMPKYLFAFSEGSCDVLYPTKFSLDLSSSMKSFSENNDCKGKVMDGETLFTFWKKPGLKDKECESEPIRLKTRCYFKKALDTKNYQYCYGTTSKNLCIGNLARVLKDKSICQYSKTAIVCEMYVEECITQSGERPYVNCGIENWFSCDGLTSLRDEKYKGECIQKYGLTNS